MESWNWQPCQDPSVSPGEEAPPGAPQLLDRKPPATPHQAQGTYSTQLDLAPLMFICVSNMFLGLSLVALKKKNPYFSQIIKAHTE